MLASLKINTQTIWSGGCCTQLCCYQIDPINLILYQGCRFIPESSRQALVSPIFRSISYHLWRIVSEDGDKSATLFIDSLAFWPTHLSTCHHNSQQIDCYPPMLNVPGLDCGSMTTMIQAQLRLQMQLFGMLLQFLQTLPLWSFNIMTLMGLIPRPIDWKKKRMR